MLATDSQVRLVCAAASGVRSPPSRPIEHLAFSEMIGFNSIQSYRQTSSKLDLSEPVGAIQFMVTTMRAAPNFGLAMRTQPLLAKANSGAMTYAIDLYSIESMQVGQIDRKIQVRSANAAQDVSIEKAKVRLAGDPLAASKLTSSQRPAVA